MIFLILDFETKDPYIGLDLGGGFPFACAQGANSLFYPIGYSYCYYNSETKEIGPSRYQGLDTKGLASDGSSGWIILDDLIKSTRNIVMHNAQYDLGCLRSLSISIKHLRVYDTKVIAKLYDNNLYSYSLEPLAKKYCNSQKVAGSLIDTALKHNLLAHLKQSNKTFEREAKKWIYSNMPTIQEVDFSAMAYYANGDTQTTAELFKFLYRKVGDKLSHFYSNIQKICVDIREPGISIDMDAVDRAINTLTPLHDTLEKELYKGFGKEINLQSHDQLPQALVELGYNLPSTPTGKPSCNKEWMEELPNDPFVQKIAKYRTVYMLLNTFSIKIKDMQQYSCPSVLAGNRIGKIYPELNLLEARTGRFSSSSPNSQNIPKRDKELASLCRAMLVPTNPDSKWYSLDWSNQEGRIQLHYAVKKNFQSAKDWQKRFLADPNIDTHRLVAEMMYGVKYEKTDEWKNKYRIPAKTIYLGKSFCMGRAKTAKRLGLPTQSTIGRDGKSFETSGPEATKLIEAYEKAFPYLTELQKDCLNVIQKQGYVKTINGRVCRRPPKVGGRNFDYKAISLVVQGGAADQMYTALTQAHEAGLTVRTIVHDEFNIEGSREDAGTMKNIMENCIKLEVPSVVEVSEGKDWGNLKEIKL